MRPLLLSALVAAAVLAANASIAAAKGISDAQVCGAAGCQAADPEKLYALMPEGNPTDAPKTAVPFLTVKLTMVDGTDQQGFGYDYLPSLGMTRPHDARNVGEWVQLLPRSRDALADAVRGIELRPASQLTGLSQPPPPQPPQAGPDWWALTGAALAGLALLALLARFATSALKERPRASKSAN